ncbi:hypothetical protein HBB16_13425 [Pseudonocardia sp. MCCB 268]|nr:hypothetical protein [Pseudonocardia cytotoxica]
MSRPSFSERNQRDPRPETATATAFRSAGGSGTPARRARSRWPAVAAPRSSTTRAPGGVLVRRPRSTRGRRRGCEPDARVRLAEHPVPGGTSPSGPAPRGCRRDRPDR